MPLFTATQKQKIILNFNVKLRFSLRNNNININCNKNNNSNNNTLIKFVFVIIIIFHMASNVVNRVTFGLSCLLFVRRFLLPSVNVSAVYYYYYYYLITSTIAFTIFPPNISIILEYDIIILIRCVAICFSYSMNGLLKFSFFANNEISLKVKIMFIIIIFYYEKRRDLVVSCFFVLGSWFTLFNTGEIYSNGSEFSAVLHINLVNIINYFKYLNDKYLLEKFFLDRRLIIESSLASYSYCCRGEMISCFNVASSPQVADQSLFTKSRVEENTIARKAELAATYSNINSSVPSASVVVYPNGYLLSPKANRSSFPVLCKTLTEPNTAESKRESRLSFLTTSISPMTNNNFRTSADTGLNEPNSKESSLKSSSSQERISQRLSQTDATSPRQKLSSSGRGSEFLAQGYTPRSAHGRECPSIPLPAPPAAPSRAPIVVSSPRSKPGGKKMSQIIASGQISPYSYSPHSPFSPNSSGTAAGTVICAAGDGARKVDEDGWIVHGLFLLVEVLPDPLPGSRNTGGGECAPHVRPVSQSEENFPCVNESRKESTEFEFSTLMHGASESFRPNGFSISFSKAGEDPADLLNSRKDTPPLREASDIPRTQTPEMPIKAPNALTAPPCEPRIPPASGPALALPPPCDPQIPPASGPATVPVPSSLSPFSKDRMIGARRFSTSVYPPANPLRRMSSIPGFSPVQHSLNESPNSLPHRSPAETHSSDTAAPSRRISVYHPPENLKSWSYRVDKNEWIQIPVLFDLFTYLIQFHELQERTCEDRSEATIMEEALSCLVSRISHSIYEVDGVLLSSLFTTWENPNHKQLVKNLCDSWKVGYNSHEFQEASMTLLRAISDNDVSDVRFTRLYKLGNGASLAALIIIGYLLANKIALAIHIVLLLLALLLTTCITLLSIITLSHNSFADAASTFFREDARSATQLETYFTGGEDEDRVEYIDSGLPQDTGVEGNSHHTYPEGHGRGNFSHNRNASHHSFLTVFSNSGEAGDSEQGDSHGVMGTESETLNHLFLNSATAIPDRNGGFGVVGLPNASVDNPLIAEAQDLSFSGPSHRQTEAWQFPVVMLTEERGGPQENSDAAGSDVVEERRLKRSESKRYLLSRSTTGNTSGLGRGKEGGRRGAQPDRPWNNSPPLEQRHYDAFISALQRRGFVVREYDSVGLLDEGFHQGANKFCLLALPLEMWTSSRKWRTVFSRWLEIERRAVYFYRMSKSSSNSSTGDHHGVSALPSGDGVGIGAVPSTASFSRGRKDALPTLTLVDEPQPPANTCLSLPLSDVLSSRIYQRVSDRNLKKVILHSYVPPYILGSRLGNGAFASVFEAGVTRLGSSDSNIPAYAAAHCQMSEGGGAGRTPIMSRYAFAPRSSLPPYEPVLSSCTTYFTPFTSLLGFQRCAIEITPISFLFFPFVATLFPFLSLTKDSEPSQSQEAHTRADPSHAAPPTSASRRAVAAAFDVGDGRYFSALFLQQQRYTAHRQAREPLNTIVLLYSTRNGFLETSVATYIRFLFHLYSLLFHLFPTLVEIVSESSFSARFLVRRHNARLPTHRCLLHHHLPSSPSTSSERPAAVAEGTFLHLLLRIYRGMHGHRSGSVGLPSPPRAGTEVNTLPAATLRTCEGRSPVPVKPPPRLLRLYPGVVLAVTFTEPAAAEAAVALSSALSLRRKCSGLERRSATPGGTRGAERDGSAAAHGFRISPIRAFRLGAEDAEDCRKTFMPKELMLRLRATKTADPRRGTEPRGYLPLSHTPQLTQNKKDKDPPQRADPGADLVPRHDLTVEEELRRANARWRISERLWFVMCSNLSWYARKMDWRAAESAAARGDAVVIDETSCFEVFDAMIPPPKTEQGEPCGTAGATDSTTTVPRPQAVGASGTALGGSQGLGVGPTLLSSVRERVGGRGSARDAESFDALAALQKTYGLKPPNAEKEHRRAAAATTASPKFRNWSPGRFLPGWSRRMGQQALVDGSSEDEGLPQPSGLLPWVWRWLAPGSSWSTLSACRRKPYGDDADQPDKQRRRLEAPPSFFLRRPPRPRRALLPTSVPSPAQSR
eukprot:gene10842-7509_t